MQQKAEGTPYIPTGPADDVTKPVTKSAGVQFTSICAKSSTPQAHNNYRVILKREDGEFEIGSIGIQHAAGASYFWAWGIDTVIPMRTHQTQGKGKDRRDCMRKFKAAESALPPTRPA